MAKHTRMSAITKPLYTQLMATKEISTNDITTTTTDLDVKLQNAVAIFNNTTKPRVPIVDLTTAPAPVPPPQPYEDAFCAPTVL